MEIKPRSWKKKNEAETRGAAIQNATRFETHLSGRERTLWRISVAGNSSERQEGTSKLSYSRDVNNRPNSAIEQLANFSEGQKVAAREREGLDYYLPTRNER